MSKLIVSSPPHIRAEDTTQSIMLDVIIALLPAVATGIYFFGYRAGAIVAITVLAAVLFEYLWNYMFKKPSTIWDLSAIVAGIILALNLPPTVPLWIPVIGSFFMIVIVKMCFGGLGQNFMNPAAAARAFLMASWLPHMTKFVLPGTPLGFMSNADVTSTATPLSGLLDKMPSQMDMYLGKIGGCIGEVSTVALLLGGLYLLYRRVISWQIPVAYLGTVAALAAIFGQDPMFHLLAGGLMLGAIFMATDYTTSPVTPFGKWIYGIGLGGITVLIRLKGGYPEGVCYSILLMNVISPLIDKFTPPRRFGGKLNV